MLLLLLLGALVGVARCDSGPVVISPAGSVWGWESLSRDGRLYQAWTSIPYARPPVGHLRFKAPQPADKWRGVLNATEDMPVCYQLEEVSQEDCLYLSVYKPKISETNLPVVVFLHAGAYGFGNSGPRDRASYLMDENLIFVPVHYRLNGFGFATLGDDVLPGNFGLKDAVLALRWVRANIRSFGGDPERVTLLGGSSGGIMVHLLINSPLAQDVVTQGYSYSGVINYVAGVVETEFAANWTLESVRLVGCDREDHRAILLCLQRANASALQSAFSRSLPLDSSRFLAFGPVIEPSTAELAVITEDLSLRPSTKPWITSVANGEFLLFTSYSERSPPGALKDYQDHLAENMEKFVRTLVSDKESNRRIQEIVRVIVQVYDLQNQTLDKFARNLHEMLADVDSIYPALYNMLHYRGPKWMYQLEYKGEVSLVNSLTNNKPFPVPQAAHADDGVFLVNYRQQLNAGPEDTQADYVFSKKLIKYLANFANHSDPNPTGSKTWRQFGEGNIYRVTGQEDRMGDEKFLSLFRDKLQLWSQLIGRGPSG